MVASRVGGVLRGASAAFRGRTEFVPASRVVGSELIHIGGGEMVATPGVPALPTTGADQAAGLCAASLALPPVAVRSLNEVQICLGENVLRNRSGAVVLDNPTRVRLQTLSRRGSGAPVIMREGNATLYGPFSPGTFESLVESLCPVVLFQHPALAGRAPISVLRTATANLVEEFLLGRLEHRQLQVVVMPAGSKVEPEHTLMPSPGARHGAGALPRWYRRWIDAQTASVACEPVAKRLVLTHGPGDPLLGSPEILASAARVGFSRLDTLTGEFDGTSTLDASSLIATLRDAKEVLGVSDDALGHTLVCRRAEILHLGLGETVRPRVAQLAASKALPYRYLGPEEVATL